MYPNLNAEMARQGLTAVALSEKTGIRYQTLTYKLAGKTTITLDEALLIKKAVETELPIEVLFEKRAA